MLIAYWTMFVSITGNTGRSVWKKGDAIEVVRPYREPKQEAVSLWIWKDNLDFFPNIKNLYIYNVFCDDTLVWKEISLSKTWIRLADL